MLHFIRGGVGQVGSGSKDIKELERKTGHRVLTVEEVGDSLIQSLKLDKNGAVYVIFPDVPLIEFTNIRNHFFYFQVSICCTIQMETSIFELFANPRYSWPRSARN